MRMTTKADINAIDCQLISMENAMQIIRQRLKRIEERER